MKYTITRDGLPVAQTDHPLAWFHRNAPYSMSHACQHEGYSVELSDRNRAILAERVKCLSEHEGPRVGDFVTFTDGTERRISYIWRDEHGTVLDNGIQTTNGGSFHLHESGRASYSGSLYPGIPQDTLTDTGQTRDGAVWFFHHGIPERDGAVHAVAPFRVFRCSLASNAR